MKINTEFHPSRIRNDENCFRDWRRYCIIWEGAQLPDPQWLIYKWILLDPEDCIIDSYIAEMRGLKFK